MRREAGLYPAIATRENVRIGLIKALLGKRHASDARAFLRDADNQIAAIVAGLEAESLVQGEALRFTIYDPKERLITAPCFRERVLHQAIMNVCEPVFERQLIFDTYACRVGKGREAAVARALWFARQHEWCVGLDIRRFFDSVRHDLLLRRLGRLFNDGALLRLFARVLAAYDREGTGRGLPIGSLTSQHFANSYLSPLDRLIKERLRAPGYVRYMDDFVIWGSDRETLRSWRDEVGRFLGSELDLGLKRPSRPLQTARGIDFLGARVFRSHVTTNARSRRRFAAKLADLEREAVAGEIGSAELQQRATSLVAFVRSAGAKSHRFRGRVLQQLGSGVDSDW